VGRVWVLAAAAAASDLVEARPRGDDATASKTATEPLTPDAI